MKSAYYTAVVTNTYRMAMDALARGETTIDPAWMRELESVSHRAYATGYYFSDCHSDANLCPDTGYLAEKAYLATVLAYDESTGRAECYQKNKCCLGDAVELLTPGRVGQPFVLEELWDAEGTPIQSTPHPGMRFWIKAPFPVRPGDILRGEGKK